MSQTQLAFDLMESDAIVKIFLDRSDGFEVFTAEKPALIVVAGFWNIPKRKGDKYTLWFANIERWSFKNWKDVEAKIIAILKTATVPMNPRVEGRIKRSVNSMKRAIKKMKEVKKVE